MARDSCPAYCGQQHPLVREVSACLLEKYTDAESYRVRGVCRKAGTVIQRPLQFLCKGCGSKD